MAIFRGSFLFSRARSFLHFGVKIAQSPRVFFPLCTITEDLFDILSLISNQFSFKFKIKIKSAEIHSSFKWGRPTGYTCSKSFKLEITSNYKKHLFQSMSSIWLLFSPAVVSFGEPLWCTSILCDSKYSWRSDIYNALLQIPGTFCIPEVIMLWVLPASVWMPVFAQTGVQLIRTEKESLINGEGEFDDRHDKGTQHTPGTRPEQSGWASPGKSR